MHSSFANRDSQIFSIAGTVAFRMAVAPVKGFDQRRIVPILDVVVLAVVYLHLNGIAMVVALENRTPLGSLVCFRGLGLGLLT